MPLPNREERRVSGRRHPGQISDRLGQAAGPGEASARRTGCHWGCSGHVPSTLCQDVVEASSVKEAQAPFLQGCGVGGGDAIPGPARQSTEAALKLTEQQCCLALLPALLLAFLLAFLPALLTAFLTTLQRA